MAIAAALAAALLALPADRPAAAILRDFEAVQYPSMSDGSDAESIARFERQVREAAERQQALALELARDHAGHARVAELMRLRWTLFSTVQKDGAAVLRETDEWLAKEPGEALVAAAAATRALAAITDEELPFERRRAIVEESAAAAPHETLVGNALIELARERCADPAVQRELVAEARAACGDDDYVKRDLEMLEQLAGRVGAPLELRFAGGAGDRSDDAPRSLEEWRGRPFLVRSDDWTPGWVSDDDRREAAALARLREKRPAAELPFLTVLTLWDDASLASLADEARAQGGEALWIDRGDVREAAARNGPLGISRGGCWLLVDGEGVLRGWSWRLDALAPRIDALLGAKPEKPAKKKRAI